MSAVVRAALSTALIAGILIGHAGAASAEGVPVVLDSPVDFGAVPFLSMARHALRITNTGDAPVFVMSIYPDNIDKFGVVGSTNFTVQPGDTGAATVTYRPKVFGAADTTTYHIIFYTDALDTLAVPAMGAGANNSPHIAVSPARVVIGARDGVIGRATLSIVNTGGGLLDWRASKKVGWLVGMTPSFGSMSYTGRADVTLSASAAGLAPGYYLGTVTITSNDAQYPVMLVELVLIVLDGTGPAVKVNADPVKFGTTFVGYGTTKEFWIFNNRLAFVTVTDIVPSRPEYSMSSTSFTLAPAAVLPITLTATPVATGDIGGTLTIHTDNAGSPEVSIAAEGSAVADPPPVLEVDTGILHVSTPQGRRADFDVPVGNSGGYELQWSMAFSDFTGVSVEGDRSPLSPGGTTTLHISIFPGVFHPYGDDGDYYVDLWPPGDYYNAIYLETNDPLRPRVAIPIYLTVLPAPILQVDPYEMLFSQQIAGETQQTMSRAFKNVGSAPLAIESIYTTNPVYHVGPYPTTVAGGQRVSLDVTFAPLQPAGVVLASLHIDTNGGNAWIPLRGSAAVGDPPEMSVSPLSFDVTVDARAQTVRTLTISNAGQRILHWRPVMVPADPPWLIMADSGQVAGFGGSVDEPVTFAPGDLATGDHTKILAIFSNDPVTPWVIPVTMHVNGFAYVEATPSPFDFAPTAEGYSRTMVLNVTNTGGDSLQISSVYTDGPPFAVGPYPSTLGHGENAKVAVTFSPTIPDSVTGYLTIESNAQNDPLQVLLRGVGGGEPDTLAVPVVLDSPLDLGTVMYPGETMRAMRVTNLGSRELEVLDIYPDDAAAFGASPTAFAVLPGDTVATTVTYRPSGFGTHTTTLRLSVFTGIYDTLAVTVSGEAPLTAPRIAVAPDSLLASVTARTQLTRTLTVVNTGGGTLHWTGSMVPHAEPWLSVPASGSVAPGDSGSYDVTFAPGELGTGDYTAALSIASDDETKPLVSVAVAMHVDGFASAGVSPGTLKYPTTEIGTCDTLSVVVTDTGVDTLLLSGVSTTATEFAVGVYPARVAPGKTATVPVVFAPTEAGMYAAEAVIASNASNGTMRVTLQGEGYEVPPPLPTRTALYPNRPNPFNPTTTIRYDLHEPARVTLVIYGVDGSHVRTLVSATRPAGRYHEEWDGTNAYGRRVASGVYFYRMEAGAFRETRKMVLLK